MDARERALAASDVARRILDTKEARICRELQVLRRYQQTIGSRPLSESRAHARAAGGDEPHDPVIVPVRPEG